jgi:signal transduction histidine kinase
MKIDRAATVASRFECIFSFDLWGCATLRQKTQPEVADFSCIAIDPVMAQGAVNSPQDHDKELLAAGGSPATVIRHKDRILARFRDRVRAVLPAAMHEAPPMIIDTLPAFITRLALALAPDSGMSFASEYSNIAMQHGNERAKLTGYSLAEVIREYQFLREIIVETLRDETRLTAFEWDIVHRSIDEAMSQSAAAFVAVQSRFRDLFTAALSHDFRGPLQNAINFLELLRRDADPAQRGHYATRAVSNLRRVDQMIGLLLDVTRSNSGARLPVRLEPCEAGRIVREVIDDMSLRSGDRFELDIERPIHGYFDCDRLRQAVENLLTNAVKYGRSDTPITTRVAEQLGRLFISIHNEGDPIPESELPVLFQPFRRSLRAQRSDKDGWGLGLVLVQSIAEAHGGSVAVESQPNDGTTFTLNILCDAREWRSRQQ